MKHLSTLALALTFSAPCIHAQQTQPIPVWTIDSGTAITSQLILQPGTITTDVTSSGNSSLGAYTFHLVQNASSAPVPSATCVGALLNFPALTGAGIYRFQDGSLLIVKLKEGSACVDLVAGNAKVTTTYQITGGTGIFKGASGTLTGTALSTPVLFDSTMSPVFFSVTGESTGTIVLSNN